MAFNVNFWTFSKKEKSTAQPAGQATVYSCVANGDLDLLAPRVRLNVALNTSSKPTVFNYAQIPAFGRYYHVTGWTVRDGLWEAQLQVDPWASWKTGIGNYSTYIYRSSNTFNGDVIDSLYPAKAKKFTSLTSITSPWLTGTVPVIGVVSGDDVRYYSMGSLALQDFLGKLFSDDYAAALLGVLNISTYPEAKIAVNPLQYIITTHRVPVSPSLGNTQLSSLQVGGVTIGVSHVFREIVSEGKTSVRHTIAKANYPVHPQAASRGSWLNVADMEYKLHIPPFGMVDIPAGIMWDADSIGYQIRCDVRTGDAHMDVIAVSGASDIIISRIQGNLAIPFPLTHVYNLASSPVYSYQSDSVLGNIGQLVEDVSTTLGGKNAIGNAMTKRANRLSMSGSVGSSVSYEGPCYLEASWHEYVDDDNSENGRPLCEIKTISNIPGYVQCCSDALSIACTTEELNDIKAGMESGFYYE